MPGDVVVWNDFSLMFVFGLLLFFVGLRRRVLLFFFFKNICKTLFNNRFHHPTNLQIMIPIRQSNNIHHRFQQRRKERICNNAPNTIFRKRNHVSQKSRISTQRQTDQCPITNPTSNRRHHRSNIHLFPLARHFTSQKFIHRNAKFIKTRR